MRIHTISRPKMVLLIAIIATSGFLAVFLPMTATAADAKPISLVLTPTNMTLTQDFSFGGNDSRALSYELSIPAGKQVNITFTNKNGTQLLAAVSYKHTMRQCGYSIDMCADLFSNTIGGTNFAPQTQAVIFTALVDTKLCISVQANSYNTPTAKIYRWSETGGSIGVRDTGNYNATAMGPTENSVTNVNMTNDNQEYVREFTVNTAGYYFFNSTASKYMVSASNPDTDVYVLLKGTGVQALLSGRLGGAATEIAKLNHDTSSPTSSRWTIAYLETGKTYVLLYKNDGFVNLTSWELIKPVQGVLGTGGVTLDYTSTTATVYRHDPNTRMMFVDFATLLKYDVLYDIAWSGDDWPNRFTADLFAADNGMQAGFNPSSYLTSGHAAQLLLLEDKCEPISQDGQLMGRSHKYLARYQENIGWGNTTLANLWYSNPVNREWNLQHQLFAVTFSNATPIVSMPTSVKLSVSEHAGGVPTFPGVNTGGVYNGTVTFRNDGATVENGVGLYKIAGQKDTELQLQFTQMETLWDPEPYFSFVTAKGQAGALVGQTMSTGFGFDNSSRTHTTDGNHPEWDTPIVWEVALFEDPVYVIIGIDSYDFTPASNSTAITMSYKYEPFVAINTPFTVSRDNQLQVFKAFALPASAQIQAFVDSGACCSEVTGSLYFGSSCPCLSMTYNMILMMLGGFVPCFSNMLISFAFPGSPVAYTVFVASLFSGVSYGTVLRINIWSGAPIEWLPWIIAIAAIVGLVVVAIVMRKRK